MQTPAGNFNYYYDNLGQLEHSINTAGKTVRNFYRPDGMLRKEVLELWGQVNVFLNNSVHDWLGDDPGRNA